MNVDRQFDSPGFYIQWHFTETCNLRCRHCYQENYKPCLADRNLVTQTINQIERLLSSWEMQGRVSITGGEPFCDPETLFFILQKLSDVENVQHIGLLTNGTLLTNEMVERLRKFSKIKEIQVSLDGSTAATHDSTRGEGAFKRTMGGLEKLISAGFSTSIMFTASALNASDAVNVINLAENIGVSAITVERYTSFHKENGHDPLALTPELTYELFSNVYKMKQFLQQAGSSLRIRTSRPLWALISDSCGGVCPVGFSCLTIMPDGTVYPCRRLPISLGTIQKDGLFKIWYSSPILLELRNRKNVVECSTCDKRKVCGGCRASAYAEGNDFMGKDPLCWRNQL